MARTDVPLHASTQPPETDIAVFVNPEKKFQDFLGIGGALTDASADVFAKLPAARQQELLTAYYDPAKGIGYTLGRTSIHSSDFSAESYTYVAEGDRELKTFSIDHDRANRLPLIHKAIAAAGGKLTLYVSPWSPPAFMKDTHDMLHGGRLLPEYRDAWAHYVAKFIKAYEAEGVPVWGLTVQNEPMAKQTWESCIYTAEDERDYLKNNLGPVLAKEGLGDKKIIVWDHNRDLINYRLQVIYGDPEAAKYVWGAGFHWYENWAGGACMYDNVRLAWESYPDKHLIFTEGCVESFKPEAYQNWSYAERYGTSMINDFNSGASGWTDWNILLDERGGPNHVGNFCCAPVHANAAKGDLVFTPSYWYIGHFSKFIRPGAVRVSAASSRSALQCTAFRNKDGSVVTVVMNSSGAPISYRLMSGNHAADLTIPAHGIQTAVY